MIHFDHTKLLPGDIMAVRSKTPFGKLIRATLGSYTNHNALFLADEDGEIWAVGEAIQPTSCVTPLTLYALELNAKDVVVRVLRVPGAKKWQREEVSQFFLDNLLNIPYPVSVFRLWVFRLVNSLPWTIEGGWCTRLVWDAWNAVIPGVLDHPDGREKKNPTPRTIENRLVAGVLEDVTGQVLVES